MAGGVMTCQLTGMPCMDRTMAIVVRQGRYTWDRWTPISLPHYGQGNDDFMALDPCEPSQVNDSYAQKHGFSDREGLLEEAFIGNNYLTVHSNKLPFGLIYVDCASWEAIRPDVIKLIKQDGSWYPTDSSAVEFATNFAVETKRHNEIYTKLLSGNRYNPVVDSFRMNSAWDTSRSTYNSSTPILINQLSAWSEHVEDSLSLESFYSILVEYVDNGDVLLDFFNKIIELYLVAHALRDLRMSWAPRPSPQEYELTKLQLRVAKLIRK